MNSVSDLVMRKSAMGALIAFVGICAVAEGEPDAVWLVAAGIVIIILARAIHTSMRGE